MQVIAVLTGKPEKTPAKSGLTGHFKKPVPKAIVTPEGLSGDHIEDRKNHGGPDQAVYIFGEQDSDWWSGELGRPIPPGFFGENLLLSALTSTDICVGDRFQIGDVTLEITAPRIPCATYAAHIGNGQAIKQFYRAGRPGAYARVLSTGEIAQEMPVHYSAFAGPKVRIVDIMAQSLHSYPDDGFLKNLLQTPAHHKLLSFTHARFDQT